MEIPDHVTTRPETFHDYIAIENVHVAAFANHPYSRQTEHVIVNASRADHALTVSLVAEMESKVVAHMAFSPIKINGRDYMWCVLGPVGVFPGHQRRGIEKQLIYEGLKAIRSLGTQGCVLVGDPAYCSRFGFTHQTALVLEGVLAEDLMCLSMTDQVPVATFPTTPHSR
jgi:putative acetyltransferase